MIKKSIWLETFQEEIASNIKLKWKEVEAQKKSIERTAKDLNIIMYLLTIIAYG